jgi:hypothetical protein
MAHNLRHLTREECLVLLGREQFGRVSVSIGVLPAILPMKYALVDDAIVLRTSAGTKLAAALMDAVVGFEVDRVDSEVTSGWSVLVFGHASDIRDHLTLEQVRGLSLPSWASGERDHFNKIPIERISGRAFGSLPNLDAPFEHSPASAQ